MNVDQTFQTKPASDTIAEHILITKAQSAVFMGACLQYHLESPVGSLSRFIVNSIFADCNKRQLSTSVWDRLSEIFENIPGPACGQRSAHG